MKTILLTFDIEEFDLPVDFGSSISDKDKYKISKVGTEILLDILERNNVKATFFTTTNFALKYPELARKISRKHELAFHGYSHKDNYSRMNEREIIERIKDGK